MLRFARFNEREFIQSIDICTSIKYNVEYDKKYKRIFQTRAIHDTIIYNIATKYIYILYFIILL